MYRSVLKSNVTHLYSSVQIGDGDGVHGDEKVLSPQTRTVWSAASVSGVGSLPGSAREVRDALTAWRIEGIFDLRNRFQRAVETVTGLLTPIPVGWRST